MSNSKFFKKGTFTGDGNSDPIYVCGWATAAVTLNSGTGTFTLQVDFMDGNGFVPIVAGDDNLTTQAYTATFSLNMFYGDEVRVRIVASSTSSPDADWVLKSNPKNRPT